MNTLPPINSNAQPFSSLPEEEEIMLTDTELQLKARTQELVRLAAGSISDMAEEIIIKAIAHEEVVSQTRRQRMNLAGMSALMKLLLAMRGVDEEGKKDIDVGDIPHETDQAINFLVSKRAKGILKSVQSNDLATLVGKRSELMELKRLQDMVAALEAKQLSTNTNSGTPIPITRREDIITPVEKSLLGEDA
jgi:hypothetical protein